MALHSSNLDYYHRMQELEERLKRSEEERMLLQRQFDLLMQANKERERARVSIVEARYKRFLDEDKRRRDRNSSLLQALDRIDSHTASLAAKTERMRALRKRYEAFIAHSYPGWHAAIERPHYPLAAIAPAPNVMTRVTDLTGYNAGDYSETQYHALPGATSKALCPLSSPHCLSDLAIASRDNYPMVGRSPFRSGSAVRSASLSPSRVRDLSSRYDSDKKTSFRNYDFYSPSKSPDAGLSSRLRSESHFSRRNDVLASPRPKHTIGSLSQEFSNDEQIFYRPLASTNHRILDYDHGSSDIEVDQNTSGDLLNLSNLSLSDDGISNEPETPDSPPYSGHGHHSFMSPRDYTVPKKSASVSLPSARTSLINVSPRDVFVPKRSVPLSPAIFTSSSPKSILSPRTRKSDIPSSLPLSDNTNRMFLSAEDPETRRSDASLSPRGQKTPWHTFRPSYLPPPSRSTIRRSVTFTEPEFESPCVFRDEDAGMYSGSYGSLRRHSPSLAISSWESTDHERYLREKQGREKDAFREKIERLKELIQENKEQEGGIRSPLHDTIGKSDFSQTKFKDQQEKISSRDNSLDRDWKMSKSRRPSVAVEVSSDSEEQLAEEVHHMCEKISGALEKKLKSDENDDAPLETISDKEQWSGQFSEKDEDVKEEVKIFEVGDNSVSSTKLDEFKVQQDMDLSDSYNQKSSEAFELKEDSESLGGKLLPKIEQKDDKDIVTNNYNHDNHSIPEQTLDELYKSEPQFHDKQASDFTYKSSKQAPQGQMHDVSYEVEQTSKEPSDFSQNEPLKYEQEVKSNFPQSQENQKQFVEYPESYNYEGNLQKQDWNASEKSGSQPVQQYTYDQTNPLASGYGEQERASPVPQQEGSLERYPIEGEQRQSYDKYQADTNQQSQRPEEYNGASYSTYQEPQQPTDLPSDYQDYTDDPSQYQQAYQYSGDQQYIEQQDQNYTADDQGTYQYPQDPAKTQYEYEGQEYNYQQNQDNYNYQQDQNYQQDAAYPQDESYQQDQNYQNEDYAQDQQYQPDQQYQQDSNYQQGLQYQDTGYDGSQQYESYQQGPDEVSEDTTTPSTDLNYQREYQGKESTEQQQTLDQYRALLGVDPGSEPVYSDSSEIENQMAAVVGQGITLAASPAEPVAASATPTPVTAPSTTPPTTTPTSITPPATAGTGKVKAGAKKKPQLTRKPSSVTPENVEGKQQQASNLPKTPELEPVKQQNVSSFESGSSH